MDDKPLSQLNEAQPPVSSNDIKSLKSNFRKGNRCTSLRIAVTSSRLKKKRAVYFSRYFKVIAQSDVSLPEGKQGAGRTMVVLSTFEPVRELQPQFAEWSPIKKTQSSRRNSEVSGQQYQHGSWAWKICHGPNFQCLQ